MEIKIQKLYSKDCAVIFSAMMFLWVVLTFIMFSISDIVSGSLVRTVIIAAGIMAGAFATASSIAVLVHLKKNKQDIYLQELQYQKRN